MARDTADRGWPRAGRRGSAGALPILLLAAALASSLSFVLPTGSDVPGAPSRSLLRQSGDRSIGDELVEPRMTVSGDQSDGSSGLGISKGMFVGMLAIASAILLAIGTPQPASAGLLSELKGSNGGIDYDSESQRGQLKNKKLRQAVSRSKVLDSAATRAQQKALQAQRELAEKEKAENELKKLDEQKKEQEAEEKARLEKRQAQREKLQRMLEKNAATPATPGEDKAKATKVFQEFKSNRDAQVAKEEEEARKQDALRASAIKSLDERKESARKAAEEAEAIAKRIEELAKNAREAAELAKKSAELLK